jgi:hypothetical protein
LYDEGVIERAEDEALVLDVVDLFGFEDFDFFEYFGCEEFAGLFVFDETDSAEGALIIKQSYPCREW